jgi:NCS1 family nucleobase:cation symporter-1
VLIQIPFMNSSLYVGPIANLLGGAEIAWLIGLVVAGGLYYATSHNVRNRIIPAAPESAPDRAREVTVPAAATTTEETL